MIHFLHFLRDAIIERFYCYNWFYDSLAKNLEFVLSGISGHGMQTGPAFSSKRVFVIQWFWNHFVAIQWAPIRIKHLTDKCVYPMTTIGKCNIHPRKGQSLTKFHFNQGSTDAQTFVPDKEWQFEQWWAVGKNIRKNVRKLCIPKCQSKIWNFEILKSWDQFQFRWLNSRIWYRLAYLDDAIV